MVLRFVVPIKDYESDDEYTSAKHGGEPTPFFDAEQGFTSKNTNCYDVSFSV